jgi:DHA2 family multidrug resistance protein
VLGSFTMFQLSHLNLSAGYWDIFWPQVLQGVALALLFIPLMALSMASIPKEKMGNATSIFNLMRNIGGSFGIAIMTTFLARRSQFHQARLVEHVTAGDLGTRELVTGIRAWFYSQGFSAFDAQKKAMAAVYGMVQRHASMLAFVEAFWVMAVMFGALLPFLLLLRHTKLKPREKPVTAVRETEAAASPPTEQEPEEEAELILH